MSEQLNNTAETSTTTESPFDRLVASAFGVESVATEPVKEVATEQNKTTENTVVISENQEDVKVDKPNELKEHLGFENWDEAKTQWQELQKLKDTATTKEEIKFANEQSKKFFDLLKEGKEDDVYNFLNEKKKIEKYTSVEVNKDTAEEIIKLSLSTKNKNLSSKEIDFLYKQEYIAPKEPVQKPLEENEDFEERHNEWKEKVEVIEMKRMVAAKMAQPELEKLKSEIVLPDIQNNQSQTQVSQEELEKFNKVKDDYVKSIDTVLKDMNEFNIMVKDEEVDVPLVYTYSAEEKKQVASQMKVLAEHNFNVTALFDERWSNKDGSVNTVQIAKDLALLNSGDKAIQKLTNDAFSKSKLKIIQEKSNISLNTNSSSEIVNQNGVKNQLDELAKQLLTN